MHRLRAFLSAEIFVIATGFAALVHSTWSASTLFSGLPPVHTGDEATLRYAWRMFEWILPGLLIAFSLDIGQIATSHEIRVCIARGEKPVRKYIVFAVFAVATYYLQWMYMAHHVPLLPLGEGVSAVHRPFAETVRDAAVWLVPALLPLSTLLYTYSHVGAQVEVVTPVRRLRRSTVAMHVRVQMVRRPVLPAVQRPALPMHSTVRTSPTGAYTGETAGAIVQSAQGWMYTCPHCGKSKDGYASEGAARNACSAHVGRWCTERAQVDALNGHGG